jgi:hypothetical protein
LPFSEKEVDVVIERMKPDSAPGANGFIVVFKKNYGITSNRR